MVYNTPADQEGRASGWFQAGNLGGNGSAAAPGLWLAETLPDPWMAGAALAPRLAPLHRGACVRARAAAVCSQSGHYGRK